MATILIIDDEAACRNPLARLLQIEGYEITQAADGLEALQRLEERPHDLLLLDLLMPRMDGVTFLERLRGDPRFADIPVFLITANHDPRMLNRAKELGIQQYLFKGDVPFMRMLELIKKTLGEPYTPIRRGRRPKNPQAQPPPQHDGNGSSAKTGRANFDSSDDAPADAEFTRD
ncbi:MAG: CheA signal transduction histidine kinase [Phycisphaerales bacterium]|nr:CheA signal transduction histidine kinase [Phycisphaerales bacterium]